MANSPICREVVLLAEKEGQYVDPKIGLKRKKFGNTGHICPWARMATLV